MVITMAKLRMGHASTHGARKPPGPIGGKYRVSPKILCGAKCYTVLKKDINSSIFHRKDFLRDQKGAEK